MRSQFNLWQQPVSLSIFIRGKEKGLTLVEALVAFTILMGGAAIFYWQIHQRIKQQERLRWREFALEAARTEIESLRGLPKNRIRDTSYFIELPAEKKLKVMRIVMDSIKIENMPTALTLDAQWSPKALREPLEVQVKIMAPTQQTVESNSESFSAWFDSKRDTTTEIFKLTAKLPNYQWH